MSGRNCRIIPLFFFLALLVPGPVFAQASNMVSLVPKEAPNGWLIRGTPKIFNKDELFEHINGQADLFIQYGFEKSIFTVYKKNSSDELIDLDIYDMGSVVQAFGIFSRFRQEAGSADIGLESNLADHHALFYKGKYFIIIRATESNLSALRQLAKTIESRIDDNSPPPKEILYFPKKGFKARSVEYYPQGLMGRKFLGRGFKASYLASVEADDGGESNAERYDANLFLAILDSDKEAEDALKSFQEALTKGVSEQKASGSATGFDMLKGDDPYQGKLIIVQKGKYLAIAAGFEKDSAAQRLLDKLINNIN